MSFLDTFVYKYDVLLFSQIWRPFLFLYFDFTTVSGSDGH